MTELHVIRVLIVDDHPLMRSGIAGEINAQHDMKVVAEASDGEEAVAAYRVHRPDVTLMDIRMPGVSGIEAITRIRADFPTSRFVILTSSAGDVQAVRAFQAGATGYLLKNLLRTELIETIRLVHAGKRKMPPEIAQQIAEHSLEDTVTARELEVLRGVSRGRSNKIIADDLCISEHTVKNHIKSILSKLDASDRTDAVVIGIRRGYIEA
ncbi:response regulator [Granulicella sibirica]|uniref:Two component transcriptional regulator, LuxR family n=1 Tax=Granulicella sibirica TaxID=2479048 RepID=A0A4Q0T7S7_9BACT|nr:response regulator transcription factor [Granulicella sibirica]RXH58178.1 two component transcriptional regulator, LuxR family [Granulicella sibirica]